MKKILTILVMFLGLHSAYSQCTTGASIGTLTPTGVFQTIAVAAGTPAYRTFNAVAGSTYIFTYCQGGGSYTGDPYLTVATNAPAALQANDDWCGLGSEITWTAPSTGVHRLYLSGCCPCSNAPSATLAYRVNPPVNDLCGGAINLAVPSTTTGNTSTGATAETTPCGTFTSPGMWYAVVGDGQSYTASLCGSTYDTRISIYGGTCAGLTCIVQNDDFCGLQSSATWCTTVGTTYYILINGFGSNSGAWTMALSKSAVVASASPSTSCAGSPVTLTASGGSTYTWNPGNLPGSSVVVNPTSTTTYTVSTVVNGCTITRTTTVTVNPLPTVTANVTSNAVCAGQSVTFTGGGASTYTWTGGVTNGVPFTPGSTNTYTVTGTNAAGCSNTATTTVTVNPLPTVTASVTPNTVCSGQSVVFSGGGASTYTWSGGVTNNVAFTPPSSGTYTVTGTNGNGCTNTATVAVTVTPTPANDVCSGAIAVAIPSTTTGTTNNACLNTDATTCNTFSSKGMWYSVVGNGQPITASLCGSSFDTWISVYSGTCAGLTCITQNDDFCGLQSQVTWCSTVGTTYRILVNGFSTNSGSWTMAISTSPVPVTASATSNTVCAGQPVTLTGGGASTYTWSGGVTNGVPFTPVATNTYTVTGTDAQGCSNTATITVTVNTLPTVTANVTANTVCAGNSVTFTGGGATSYTWTGGVTNAVPFTPASTNTYTVTGTDGNGCSNTASTTVTVNTLPTVTANASASAVCAGNSVTVMGGGATSYTWTGGVMDNVAFTPVATDTYTVTGTDGNGCSNTASVMVTVNALPTVTASASASAVCAGNSVTVMGGGATSYTWTGGVMDNVAFTPVATDTYTVTGTDGNGCSNTASVMVTVNALPTVTASASASAVCAGNSVTVMGGGATSYTWTGGVMDNVAFTPVATDTYTVTGTDGNGCSNTASVMVTVNALPTVTASAMPTAVCAGGSAMVMGGGASTYVWTGGVMDAVNFTPVATDTYTVTGTDGNGCSNTASVMVTVNALPTVTASSTASTVCAGDSVTVMGGGATSYTWTGGVTDMVAFTPVATDTYTVTGTDGNGCSDTASVMVTVNALPVVTVTLPIDTICVDDFAMTLSGETPAGGTWSGPGVTGNSFDPMAAGVGTHGIDYMYTDSIGCAATATDSVVVDICLGTAINNAGLTSAVVYPNPNSGSFTLAIGSNVGDMVIEITDATGRVVYASNEQNVQAGFNTQIDMVNLSNGMYFMRLTTVGEQQVIKISVQK